MANDPNLKIKLAAEGGSAAAKEVAKVELSLDDLVDKSRETKEALNAVAIALDNTGEEGSQSAVEMRKTIEQLDVLEEKAQAAARAQKQLAAAGPGVQKSSSNAGFAVLELSRAIEDAQYGIRGVLNNIPGLITMLGGGAGLAGVISLAAVGLSQLLPLLMDTGEAAKQEAEKLASAQDTAAQAVENLNKRLEAQRQARADAEAASLLDLGRAAIDRWNQEESALTRVIAQYRAYQAIKLEEISAGAAIETARVNASEAAGTMSRADAIAARAAITDKAEAEALAERQRAAEMEIAIAAQRVRNADAQLVDLRRSEENAARQAAGAAGALTAGQGAGAAFDTAVAENATAQAALETARRNAALAKSSRDLEAMAAAQATLAKATREAAAAQEAQAAAQKALDEFTANRSSLEGNAAAAAEVLKTARQRRIEAEAESAALKEQVAAEETLIRLRQTGDANAVARRALERGINTGSALAQEQARRDAETQNANADAAAVAMATDIRNRIAGANPSADQGGLIGLLGQIATLFENGTTATEQATVLARLADAVSRLSADQAASRALIQQLQDRIRNNPSR